MSITEKISRVIDGEGGVEELQNAKYRMENNSKCYSQDCKDFPRRLDA
jgi:hypothetical protein